MSEDIVKTLETARHVLLREDGDRDLGFQSNITTDVSLAIAAALKTSIDTIEALRGEVERLRSTFNAGTVEQILKVTQDRAEKAEAENARLKGALEKIVAQAPKHSPEMGDDYGANFDDAWSGGWDSGFNAAADFARKALAGETT